MPTKSRREDAFIERFLSAYENHSWADAEIDWLDKKSDGAIEARVTRISDGKTLAIEHTIIEPFVGDKEDFASFKAAFPRIEEDESLLVPGRWIRVFVPVGTLRYQRKKPRETQSSKASITGSRRIGFLFATEIQSIVARSLGFPYPASEVPHPGKPAALIVTLGRDLGIHKRVGCLGTAERCVPLPLASLAEE